MLKEYNLKANGITCIFCKDVHGVITENNFGWAHITCVNWMPEIWYDDQDNKKICGKMNKDREGLFCHICKDRSRQGMLLQCDFKNC